MKTGTASFALVLLSLCVITCAQNVSGQPELTSGGTSMSKLQGLIFSASGEIVALKMTLEIPDQR